jgi:hypothetical protein
VRDIAAAGTSGLFRVYGVGPLGVARLAACLKDEIQRSFAQPLNETKAANSPETIVPTDTIAVPTSPEVEPPASLHAQLAATLSSLYQRDVEVLKRRLGYYGPPENLEDIGAKLGVTRERARQRESRALENISRTAGWNSEASARITKLFAGRAEALFIDLLAVEDRWFDGFEDHLLWLGRLLETFCGASFHLWPLRGRLVLARISQDQWDELVSGALAALTAAGPITEPEVKLYLESMATKVGAGELAVELFSALRTQRHFARQDDGPDVLVNIGGGQRGVIAAILKDAQCPLKISEIISRFTERTGKKITQNNCRGIIRGIGAHLVAPSTFVLPEYLGLPLGESERIVAAAESIVEQGSPRRQWHCAELLTVLARQEALPVEGINPYVLNALLTRSERLRSLKRLVWIARSVRTRRRDIADLCVAVLRKAGRPMSTSEMRAAVEKVRGLNSGFQPFPNEVMTRVGKGLWVLVDRDIPLSKDERGKILEALARILRVRQDSLHVRDLVATLAAAGCPVKKGIAPEMIAGLALADYRFRSMRGKRLGLTRGV